MLGSESNNKVDKLWVIDKFIELGIFILGFVIALYIDDARIQSSEKQLKTHYLKIISSDLEADLKSFNVAFNHDSTRAAGCDYILSFLIKKQNAEILTFGKLVHNSQGRIGPGFQFDKGKLFKKGDTIQILSENKGWLLDTSNYWVNKQIIKNIKNKFDWFSQDIDSNVKNKIEFYSKYVDDTKTVFQQTTGNEALIGVNTSSILNKSNLEKDLSSYYKFGSFLSWLEDFYRNNYFIKYNDLRYTYGKVSLFSFLYKLDSEQNNELIELLTIASIHAKKEANYYKEAIELNKNLQQQISNVLK
tara:strand:+ start:4442 stop:5350 length:909 start_codon:yes stop_codon:yes gene_type:complete